MDLENLESEARELITHINPMSFDDLTSELISNQTVTNLEEAGIPMDDIVNTLIGPDFQALLDLVHNSTISDEDKEDFFKTYIEAVKNVTRPQTPPVRSRVGTPVGTPVGSNNENEGSGAAGGYGTNNMSNGSSERQRKSRKAKSRKSRKAKSRKSRKARK
jgi:hypothetical protein